MPLTEINIENIRSYTKARLAPHPKINIIHGDNASGKTTLLEAINLLTSSKSFRTNDLNQVCRRGNNTSRFQISAEYQNHKTPPATKIAFSFDTGRKTCIVSGQRNTRIAELAAVFPTIHLSPDSHFTFQTQAKERRSIIDWLLFHVKPSFYETWSRFRRITEQRNELLGTAGSRQALSAWNQEYVAIASQLTEFRAQVISELQPIFQKFALDLLGSVGSAEIQYLKGWEDGLTLEEALEADFERDRARGITHSGPHRSDLLMHIDMLPARSWASHGQYKLLVLALRLAQIQLLTEQSEKECCLLIDDMPAELDKDHREKALNLISKLPTQIFLTATNIHELSVNDWSEFHTFHVEHGQIKSENSLTKQCINCYT